MTTFEGLAASLDAKASSAWQITFNDHRVKLIYPRDEAQGKPFTASFLAMIVVERDNDGVHYMTIGCPWGKNDIKQLRVVMDEVLELQALIEAWMGQGVAPATKKPPTQRRQQRKTKVVSSGSLL